jgi:anti-repressor protein
MNNLTPFMYGSNAVRTVIVEDQPWFVAKDVCEVLEISNPTDAIKRLDDDERARFNLGRQGEVNIINEPGIYSLILGSRKPEAKQFKRWITHEVIPSIRKHGAYITPETMERTLQDPDYIIGVISALKKEQDQRKALEQRVNEDRPKVVFAEALEVSKDSILVAQLAMILKQNGINIGQNRLFRQLREQGYLCKSGDRYNLPTQKSMNLGILETQVRMVGGGEDIKRRETPKVTGKGQSYFINKFKKAGGFN